MRRSSVSAFFAILLTLVLGISAVGAADLNVTSGCKDTGMTLDVDGMTCTVDLSASGPSIGTLSVDGGAGYTVKLTTSTGGVVIDTISMSDTSGFKLAFGETDDTVKVQSAFDLKGHDAFFIAGGSWSITSDTTNAIYKTSDANLTFNDARVTLIAPAGTSSVIDKTITTNYYDVLTYQASTSPLKVEIYPKSSRKAALDDVQTESTGSADGYDASYILTDYPGFAMGTLTYAPSHTSGSWAPGTYDVTVSLTPTFASSLYDNSGGTINPVHISGTGVYIVENIATLSYDCKEPFAPRIEGTCPGPQYASADGAELTVAGTDLEYKGFTFKGWSTDQSATAVTHAAGSKITMTKDNDVTLYAVWESAAPTSITVRYDGNANGAVVLNLPAEDSVTSGTEYTFDTEYTPIHPDGLTFIGWNTDQYASTSIPSAILTTNPTIVYAIWASPKVTLSYDANANGEMVGDMPSQQQVDANSSVTLSTNVPTRIGYKFNCWTTTPNDISTKVTSPLSIGTANVTLYALWDKDTVQLTYDPNANGAYVTGMPDPPTVLIPKGEDFELDKTSRPTRAGFDFDGWSKRPYPADKVEKVNTNVDITVYAIWNAVTPTSYTLHFDKNAGGDDVTNMPADYIGTQDEIVDLQTIPEVPVRSGYNFRGWAQNAADTNPLDQIQLANNLTTVYAVWAAKPQTTVVYNKNTTADVQGMPANGSGFQGDSFTLSTNTPTRTDGYTFVGWNINSAAATGMTQVNLTGATMNVYAIWQAPKVTLTYDANANGETVQNLPANVQADANTEVNLTVDPMPARTGYTFEGWSTVKGDSTTKVYSNRINVGPSGVTVYALWDMDPVSVTYAPNGTNVTFMPNPASVLVPRGLEYTLITSPSPERTGFSFGGWAENAADMTPVTKVTPTTNTTVFAIWTPLASDDYELIYDANAGGDTVTNMPLPSVGKKDNSIPLDTTKIPVRSGYRFKGWAAAPTDTTTITSVTLLTNPTKVYAIWEVVTRYTLTYDKNAGTDTVTGMPANTTADDGTSVTLTGTPTRAGYIFGGWTTAADDAGTKVTSVVLDANKKVYALWTADNVNVTYDPNANGETVTGMPDPSTVQALRNVNFPLDGAASPFRNGYMFRGWGMNPTDTSVIYTIKPTANTTVYALWQSMGPNEYELIYEPNAGTETVTNMPANTKGTKNTNFNLDTTKTPIRNGYKFLGWAASSTDSTTITSVMLANDPTKVYAVWEPQVTLTYDPNDGGTGTAMNMPGNVLADQNSNVTLTGNPSRAGFSFEGWTTVADDANTKVTSVNVGTTGTKVYALWKPLAADDYQLNYNANAGGDVVTNMPPSSVGKKDANVTLNNTMIPVRSGYKFKGWAAAPADTTTITSVVLSTNPTTVYALWESQVTLAYDPNDGGTGTVANMPGDVIADQNTEIELTGNPSRAGFAFDGWTTVADDANTKVTKVNVGTTGIKVYALWKPLAADDYQLNYDPNAGGDVVTNMPPSSVGKKDNPVTLDNTITPIRYGYNFMGWAAAPGDTTAITSVVLSANPTTVYAIWDAAPVAQVNLVYDANANGEPVSNMPANTTGDKDTLVNLDTATIPSRAGYSFIGWAAAPTDTMTITSVTLSTDPTTVYALWQMNPTPQYALVYDANANGEPVSNMPANTSGDKDSVVMLDSTMIPNRAGYSFIGWAAAPTDTMTITSVTLSTDPTTVYALWQPIIPQYALVYDANANGENVVNMPADTSGDKDSVMPLDITTVPARAGYTFAGWAAAPTDTTTITSVTLSTDPTAVYALWQPIPPEMGQVIFDGGTDASGVPQAITALKGTVVPLNMPIPYRYNFTFEGWVLNPTDTTPVTEVTIGDTPIYLYALWKALPADPVQLIFDANTTDPVTGMPADMTDTRGAVIDLTAIPAPTRANYTFVGWMNQPGSMAILNSVTLTDNVTTLYAKWKSNNVVPPQTFFFSLFNVEESCTRMDCNKPLPATGFPTAANFAAPKADLRMSTDRFLNYELMLPSLNQTSELVVAKATEESWDVEDLGPYAGLLEGSALPGEGISVIAAHNHLNNMETGPFAFISSLGDNDILFLRDPEGYLLRYSVYDNRLLQPNDIQLMADIAAEHEDSLVLVTCENEQVDGTYANRRVVFAMPL